MTNAQGYSHVGYSRRALAFEKSSHTSVSVEERIRVFPGSRFPLDCLFEKPPGQKKSIFRSFPLICDGYVLGEESGRVEVVAFWRDWAPSSQGDMAPTDGERLHSQRVQGLTVLVSMVGMGFAVGQGTSVSSLLREYGTWESRIRQCDCPG